MSKAKSHRDPREQWLILAKPNSLPGLDDLKIDPAWLDQTVIHRDKTWRVAGIRPRDWGYGKAPRVTLAADDGSTSTIGCTILRKLLSE